MHGRYEKYCRIIPYLYIGLILHLRFLSEDISLHKFKIYKYIHSYIHHTFQSIHYPHSSKMEPIFIKVVVYYFIELFKSNIAIIFNDDFFRFFFTTGRQFFPYNYIQSFITPRVINYINFHKDREVYNFAISRMPASLSKNFAHKCFVFKDRELRHELNEFYEESSIDTSEVNLFRFVFCENLKNFCYVCGSESEEMHSVMNCTKHRVCIDCVDEYMLIHMSCPGRHLDGHAGRCDSEPTALPLIANPVYINPGVEWPHDDEDGGLWVLGGDVDEAEDELEGPMGIKLEPEIEADTIFKDYSFYTQPIFF